MYIALFDQYFVGNRIVYIQLQTHIRKVLWFVNVGECFFGIQYVKPFRSVIYVGFV